jgi:hypothetical protein
MFHEDPTRPDLRPQPAGRTPAWPLTSQVRVQVGPRELSWPVLVLAAVLLFGAGSGATLLLAHGSTPGSPSIGGPGLVPSATASPTPTPTVTPTATPAHHHHGNGGGGDQGGGGG